MSHHPIVKDLPLEGERIESATVNRPAALCMIVGFVALLAGAGLYLLPAVQPEARTWSESFAFSWLLAVVYFFTIALGGMFWTLLHNASNSGWGIAVRRQMENIGMMIPWVGVLALPLLITDVRHDIWQWTQLESAAYKAAADPEVIAGHEADYAAKVALATQIKTEAEAANNNAEAAIAARELEKLNANPIDEKAVLAKERYKQDALLYNKWKYLNSPFWYGRFIGGFLILTLLMRWLFGRSVRQDTTGGVETTFALRRWSCGILIPFALCLTFMAIDLVMTINHHWYSTMWGVYFFAGSALSGMAMLIVVVTWLQGKGHLKDVVTDEHYHIMGKLLFAFSVFWAYIAFSQFFLIWYANITEETVFYIIRNTEAFNYLSIALVVLHFFVPFLLLLPAWVKRTPRYLAFVASYILAVHLLDVYLWIIPERGPKVSGGESWYIPYAVFGDILALIAVGAILAGIFLFALRKSSLFPCRDPRLMESVNVHN